MEKKTTRKRKNEKQMEMPALQVEDPFAIYADPPSMATPRTTGTFMEGFRRFAFHYKSHFYLILLMAFVGFWYISLREPGPASSTSLLQSYFMRFNQSTAGAAYTIAGSSIPPSQIDSIYSLIRSLSPSSVTTELPAFQRTQFENDLLLYIALEKGILDSPEARLYLETVLRQAAADYYLLSQLTPEERTFPIDVPDEADVNSIYRKHRDRYTKAGIEKELALQSIRSTLKAERLRKRTELIGIQKAILIRRIQDSIGATYRER